MAETPRAIELELPPDTSRRRLVDDDEVDFEAWDYDDLNEAKDEDVAARRSVRDATSYVARRKGRVVTWRTEADGAVAAYVRWAETDARVCGAENAAGSRRRRGDAAEVGQSRTRRRYAHALVRHLSMPSEASKAPPTRGIREGEALAVEAASNGFEIPAAQLSAELRAAIERAEMWPFQQRLAAVRDALNDLRVPYATGRVELKVKRSDCYGGAYKAFKKLAPKAWRMSWFLKFDGESGLDAGGLSRDFWRLCLSRAFDEDRGLFRRSDAGNTTYDVAGLRGCRDPAVKAAKLLEYRFVGRCLAKCLFDDHTCLEAAPNVKILKYIVGEPITFGDLQLVDEELWMSLDKLRGIAAEDFEGLALTFEVGRVLRGGDGERVETVALKPDGANVFVTRDNLEEFFALRLREAVYECHREELTALPTAAREPVARLFRGDGVAADARGRDVDTTPRRR